MSKKILLVIIPIVVLIIGGLSLLLFVSSQGDTELCMQEVSKAEKYIEDGDYQTAVLCYNRAIQADKKQEEPYLGLANLYYEFGDINSAITVLRMGVENSGSVNIQNALDKFSTYLEIEETPESNAEAVFTTVDDKFNDTAVNRFSTYSYSEYSANYTIKDEVIRSGVYTVTYLNVDAQFIYKDSDDRELLDSTGRPFSYARPSEIVVNNLNVILNSSGVLSVDDIKEFGALNVKAKNKGDTKEVTFSYSNCDFIIEADKDGILVSDSKNIRIYPEPVDLEIPSETQTVATAKIDVVFTVDVSGSMLGDIDVAQDSMYEFVGALDAEDRAGLVEFNGYSNVLCPLTTDKSKINSMIGTLNASGGTAMYKGLSDALSLFDNNSEAYKMIIILSDGYDFNSSYSSDYAGLVSQALSNDIVVYTVGIGSGVDTTLLVQIASATGGQYYNAADSSEILRIFDDIQNQEIVVSSSINDLDNNVLQSDFEIFTFCTQPTLNSNNFEVKCVDERLNWSYLLRDRFCVMRDNSLT